MLSFACIGRILLTHVSSCYRPAKVRHGTVLWLSTFVPFIPTHHLWRVSLHLFYEPPIALHCRQWKSSYRFPKSFSRERPALYGYGGGGGKPQNTTMFANSESKAVKKCDIKLCPSLREELRGCRFCCWVPLNRFYGVAGTFLLPLFPMEMIVCSNMAWCEILQEAHGLFTSPLQKDILSKADKSQCFAFFSGQDIHLKWSEFNSENTQMPSPKMQN